MGKAREWPDLLTSWYRSNHKVYPWRLTKDPYPVWLSEILLQQTRIPVVVPYYLRILQKFPTVGHLAGANDSDFLSTWSGLGYYGRARNMLRCARVIQQHYGGVFPSNLKDLLSLPGIGVYTAGALRNLCFDSLTPAIDGNIARVLARLTNNYNLMDSSIFRKEISRIFVESGKNFQASEYFQSLMELGEQICLPNPACNQCPVRSRCIAHEKGCAAELPYSRPKRPTVSQQWYLLVLRKGSSHYLIQNRDRSFLKDAWMFPEVLSPTILSPGQLRKEFLEKWHIDLSQATEKATIRHSVTFRRLTVHLLGCDRFSIQKRVGKWIQDSNLSNHHTSSITRKAFQALDIRSGNQIQNRKSKPPQ